MALSSDHIDQITEYVGQNQAACPVCQSKSWELNDHAVALPYIDLEYKRLVEGSFAAAIMMTCRDCASVRFMSAGQIGLL